MALNLPPVEPLQLRSTPLETVVCQLRFDEILRIAAEPPGAFQEAIRAAFPVLSREQGVTLGLTPSQPIVQTAVSAWQFKSKDSQWSVTLAPTFLALKTSAYEHFADFAQRLAPVLAAFEAQYNPARYTRVGLRYINRIVMLREEDLLVPWHRYLNPHIASEYADDSLKGAISEASHAVVLDAAGGSSIGWRYSRDVGDVKGAVAERFTLDFDHYVQGEIAPADVAERLVEFNDTIYRLFRWCLTDELLRQLEPVEPLAAEGQ
jgi:uncharacterized protein (TIGR04255 family)